MLEPLSRGTWWWSWRLPLAAWAPLVIAVRRCRHALVVVRPFETRRRVLAVVALAGRIPALVKASAERPTQRRADRKVREPRADVHDDLAMTAAVVAVVGIQGDRVRREPDDPGALACLALEEDERRLEVDAEIAH